MICELKSSNEEIMNTYNCMCHLSIMCLMFNDQNLDISAKASCCDNLLLYALETVVDIHLICILYVSLSTKHAIGASFEYLFTYIVLGCICTSERANYLLKIDLCYLFVPLIYIVGYLSKME